MYVWGYDIGKMLNQLKQDLKKLSDTNKSKILSRYFKTGKGEYAEGDILLGVTVPEQRKIAKKYLSLTLNDIKELLQSQIHEHRLTALLILVERYKISEDIIKKDIVDFYLSNTKYVNNWDLVDSTADKILGDYLIEKDKSILYKLAKSSFLWERRITIISTFAFIKKDKFEHTFKIAEILLSDNHDLIQKAVGWMLREVGKRNQEVHV